MGDYHHKKSFHASKGFNGKRKCHSGSNGKNLFLQVPVGTQIFMEDEKTLIVDMLFDDEQFVILKGGNGGFGNYHYKTSVNRVPKFADYGSLGKEMNIWFCLKLVADVGII